jgi:5-methylcytosine-specific restriction endonuclease McrA
MSRTIIARYLNPWKFKREQEQLRALQALRQRDGDDCRRCRRPMRFDLPSGHDLAAKVESILPASADGPAQLDNACLCHRRCNAESADYTAEVKDRVRRKAEAALLSSSRQKRRA